jgi:hypothetical protein
MLVNFLQSEEARKQIVLIVDGPTAREAEAFPQPQHRLETRDGSPRRVERLEATDFWHVLLYPEMVTFDALLEVLGGYCHVNWVAVACLTGCA